MCGAGFSFSPNRRGRILCARQHHGVMSRRGGQARNFVNQIGACWRKYSRNPGLVFENQRSCHLGVHHAAENIE